MHYLPLFVPGLVRLCDADNLFLEVKITATSAASSDTKKVTQCGKFVKIFSFENP